jgi:hypothetical protein
MRLLKNTSVPMQQDREMLYLQLCIWLIIQGLMVAVCSNKPTTKTPSFLLTDVDQELLRRRDNQDDQLKAQLAVQGIRHAELEAQIAQ